MATLSHLYIILFTVDIVAIMDRFPTQGAFLDDYIERRYGSAIPHCPHCKSDYVRRETDRLFRCRSCHRKFSVLKGTLFEKSKMDLRKWLYAIVKLSYNSRKGISSCELARDLGIRQATAWMMLHKIREAMKAKNHEVRDLSYIVEMDEVYIGGKPRKHNCKWVASEPKDQTPVITIVERPAKGRPGRIRVVIPEPDHKGQRVTADAINSIVADLVHPFAAELHTDEHRAYGQLRDQGHIYYAVT